MSPAAAETGGPPALRTARDGTVLVLVPAGPFTMGASGGAADQAPPHPVDLPAFYLGRTEVTNAQFRRFLAETGRPAPDAWVDAAERWGEEAPAVSVSWSDAAAYCEWAGLRLPDEAEWEKACRGTDRRTFPWGPKFDPSRLRSAGDGPVAVGRFPEGASPYGCLDMAGNAAEWTSSWYEAYPGSPCRSPHLGRKYRVTRGGNWQLASEEFFRGACRGFSLGPVRFPTVGFRVAADAPPGPTAAEAPGAGPGESAASAHEPAAEEPP